MNGRTERRDDLLEVLRRRFASHPERHDGLAWDYVLARLEARPEALESLGLMEDSGGEPDALGGPGPDGSVAFCDCSPESPAGRRSLCYDEAARTARKEHRPEGSALGTAEAMGIALLDEDGYRLLQSLGAFDLKTSSWLLTPEGVREAGGALFGDRRYGRVFTYHNGADSYYGARGFRGIVRA